MDVRTAVEPRLPASVFRVSAALAAVAALASCLSFVFWGVFHRDAPMGVGNMRGTALTVLVVAVPVLGTSMLWAARGSLRAMLVWSACLAYLAYNAVMFCFAARFNAYFLLFTSWLALSFWSLVTLLSALDLRRIARATAKVPVHTVTVYLLVCMVLFAALWLQSIVPAMLDGSMPAVLEQAGMNQNPVWVLDFAFTFPSMLLGAVWLLRRRPWGFVVSGMMTIMLTLETAGIGVDQYYGHLHDRSASLEAIPIMVVFTVVGAVVSWLFLRGIDDGARPDAPA
jgi:hypothetical protein